MSQINQPLGIFDSGLGGLTVVRALAQHLPNESMIYFGDTARLPYGNKSKATVTRLSLEALRFLEHLQIKALVVACNSASALAIDTLHKEAQVPVLGVVDAGARAAAGKTQSGRVGVIGTRATIGSRCYETKLQDLDSNIKVAATSCPLFVPFVEEGWVDKAVTRQVAEEYLEPIRQAKVDTLILGCTHYPLLRELIQEVMGSEVTLIDSGEAVTTEVASLLKENSLSASSAPKHKFFVSDQIDQFQREAKRFLKDSVWGEFEAIDQSDIPWYDRGMLHGFKDPHS
ncbi:MAG: glutamate racemase [Candidatus Eisenbacteria bacterium]|uniref:Glutamate racemase n=1 Tax=Eiseniibacteriota bacterium TaxID=2212470 RepID=A0A7Y2E8B2_UNCEI|nr:glutamate racemase [Candidatus Eisenbacteria bacterium]